MAVWHEATGSVVEPLVLPAKAGYAAECGDDAVRRLAPVILIFSSDVEEEYVLHLFSRHL